MCQPLRDSHIFRLTDDTGMFQHAKYGVPDPTRGYTTDDNARALIMAVMLYERFGQEKYLALVYRYLSFVLNAQNREGRFKNFMGYNRDFMEESGSEDCFGRCLWALGYTLASAKTPRNVKDTCRYLLQKALPHVASLRWPRAKAYSLIGLTCLDMQETEEHVRNLAASLAKQYEEHRDDNWNWFEDRLTYSNAVLPWSLLAAYRVSGEQRLLDIARESLAFLERITFGEGYFKPVGCHGWFLKGQPRAEYDEQPLEACEMLLAYLEAYRITSHKRYLDRARKCLAWYHGYNSKGLCLIDPETGGCYDGITEKGLNLNQGAESIISYFIACLALDVYQ
ncbi:glycosyltransferase [Desulforamulus putei]|uniref:Glycosyltransferase n=1 Tax=Desulforamulus putei DSM 12395 TaxID=1121429 RepID=A0A1M4VZP2_9FIRM|nr:glycosyltransferase [Desulforamulus putei]SHE74471.1 hypothetical protein SAMN02745133_01053 [Desulforamulus putei DSM 12395]